MGRNTRIPSPADLLSSNGFQFLLPIHALPPSRKVNKKIVKISPDGITDELLQC